MKIVFFASGEIAIPCLEALINSEHEIACVVTAPDKKKGRHLKLAFTPIKELCLKSKLVIYQPSSLRSRQPIEYLKGIRPDIFVVFSYGKIIPKEILEIPKIMPINIHASLLPQYRGAAPINWALIRGEEKTGITIIKMNEKIDEGEMILRDEVEITVLDNHMHLEEKLARLAVHSLTAALSKIEKNEFKLTKQDNKLATFAPKLEKDDGRINWHKAASDIHNQIRGCVPWPGAFTFYNQELLKIWSAEVFNETIEEKHKPGEIISFDKRGILVAAKHNAILIKELQLSSGKRLNAWQFIQGHKIDKHAIFK